MYKKHYKTLAMPYVLLLFENVQVIGHRSYDELRAKWNQIKVTVFILQVKDNRKVAMSGGQNGAVGFLYNAITLLHCLTRFYF